MVTDFRTCLIVANNVSIHFNDRIIFMLYQLLHLQTSFQSVTSGVVVDECRAHEFARNALSLLEIGRERPWPGAGV